jgi:antitoxin ParD1/3/4
VSVTLIPEHEAMVRERVASGRYGDAHAVIGDALRLLEERERSEHLNALLAVGLEQAQRGELVDFTPELFEEIDRRVDEMIRNGEQPDPDVCP